MRCMLRVFMMVGAVLLFCSSCSLMPRGPLSSGEVRLVGIQMAETVHADLPYDVVVTFEAKGEPQLKKACFRWVVEHAALPSPSLYCYTIEAQTNQPMGSVCSRWLSEGQYSQASPIFCSSVEDVVYDSKGKFHAKFNAADVKLYHNKLECYVEYVQDGEIKESNKIGAKVMIEK